MKFKTYCSSISLSALKVSNNFTIVTTTVERSFFAMEVVKNITHNEMEDEWMNYCLVTYIKRDMFDNIDNELIIQHFSTM